MMLEFMLIIGWDYRYNRKGFSLELNGMIVMKRKEDKHRNVNL